MPGRPACNRPLVSVSGSRSYTITETHIYDMVEKTLIVVEHFSIGVDNFVVVNYIVDTIKIRIVSKNTHTDHKMYTID